MLRLREVDALKTKSMSSRMQVNLMNREINLRTQAMKLKIMWILKITTIVNRFKGDNNS